MMSEFFRGLVDALRKSAALERSDKPLSDAQMKGMMPLFVESVDPPDHKCGTCSMRIPGEGDRGGCTVKEGPVSLANGTCIFWAKGPAASAGDVHERRMTDEESGYIENPPGVPVNCGTCRFYEADHCRLWNGAVKDGQCCIAYSREQGV